MTALTARIWDRTELDPISGCLRWMGATTSDGYGLATVDGKARRVHIATFESEVGPVPPGHTLDHVQARGCRYRDCWNKEHLEPVPVRVNSQRATPWNRTKTSCPNGHEYAEHGVRYRCADGYVRRFCAACNNQRHLRKVVAA